MTTTFDAALAASPLLEIERRVQDRAKRTGLHDQSAEALRAMLVDEVDRWNVDFQRGIRPTPVADPESVVDRALRNLTGYGPLAPLLVDDDVWEIEINAPDPTFSYAIDQ